MDGFTAWLQMAWAWLWYNIGGWPGLFAFIGLFALSSIGSAHMFKWLHDRRQARRDDRPMYIRECGQVAAAAWRDYDEQGVRV